VSNLPWHAAKISEIFSSLQTEKDGLSAESARRRRQDYGSNALPRERRISWWLLLLRQGTSPLILILFLAAGVSLFLGDAMNAGVIAAAVFLNVAVGFVQEFKANRALERLRALVQPRARVIRDGREVTVWAEEIVPGDLLVLKMGDRAVADARVIESANLEMNEAPLTGESFSVSKTADPVFEGAILAERSCIVYAGTNVVGGRATAVVIATGGRTELGCVAEMVRSTRENITPLQAELARLARWIGLFVLILSTLLFVAGLVLGQSAFVMFEVSVALAVAAIPEGLAVTVTVVLAIGTQRILRRRALVRRLLAAETLGSVSVICTDKTGTLTEGNMKVRDVVIGAKPVQVAEAIGSPLAQDLLFLWEAALLCNDAAMAEDADLQARHIEATPTERALVEAGLQTGLSWKELRNRHVRLGEIPFDSGRKYMATLHVWKDGSDRIFIVKGAPERVFPFLTSVWSGGKIHPLTEERRKAWQHEVVRLAENGRRVLLLACRFLDRKEADGHAPHEFLHHLVLIGLVGLQDALRPTARTQILAAHKAGVRTVIVTGDHPKTAVAVGKEGGLLEHGEEGVMTGEALDHCDDLELSKKISSIEVFARVEPKHKLRIIQAWQKRGAVVAMTGDGVNDAPALKAADVGVALGSGTEVAKEAADLVLMDNDLGTITAAIEEGRVLFENIRKTTIYLMADSFTSVILVSGALLFGLPLPLLPAQILWINLVTDSLPALGLAFEPGDPDIMSLRPRKRHEPVLNREALFFIFIIGLATDVFLFGFYAWYLAKTGDLARARTLLFGAVGLGTLFYAFAVKSFRRTLFRTNPFSNLKLCAGVGIGFILMAMALSFPFFQKIFHTIPLRLSDLVPLLIMGLVKLAVIEAAKEGIIWKKRLMWKIKRTL